MWLSFVLRLAKQIDNGLICFARVRGKARNDVAEIVRVELCVLVDLAGKESFAERTEGHKPNAEFLERRNHFRFRFSQPQRVFVLQRSDRLNCVRATNCFYPGFRKAEVLHFALLNQFLHRSRHIFDGHVGVNAVLIEKIDDIGPEPLERSLGDFLDVRGPAIQPSLLAGAGINFESEFGGDHRLLAERSKRFAHQFFVGERTIDFRGIEKCDAALDSLRG